MLKKITISCAILLLITLIAGVILIPIAVRDTIRNADGILSNIIRSTPVTSYDASSLSCVNIDMGDSQIILEQSSDDNIYLRVEGLFADEYQLLSEQTIGESGESILTLRMDDDALFFDSGISSYLVRRGLLENSYTAAILRIPETVSVTTTGSPYHVQYKDNVKFQNRSYYDNCEWQEEEQLQWEQEHQLEAETQMLYDKYSGLITAFYSDLETACTKRYSEENPDFDALDNEIDQIVNEHYSRMQSQLFPSESSTYDLNTLCTMLQNYLSLSGQLLKQEARLELGYYDTEEEALSLAMENRDRLDSRADDARDRFDEMYRSYLDSVMTSSSSEEASSASSEETTEEKGEVKVTPKPSEEMTSSEATISNDSNSSSSDTNEIIPIPILPESSSQPEISSAETNF